MSVAGLLAQDRFLAFPSVDSGAGVKPFHFVRSFTAAGQLRVLTGFPFNPVLPSKQTGTANGRKCSHSPSVRKEKFGRLDWRGRSYTHGLQLLTPDTYKIYVNAVAARPDYVFLFPHFPEPKKR